MKVTTRRLMMSAGFAVLTIGLVVPLVGAPPPPPPLTWDVGDVFVSLSGGAIQVRDKANPGSVKQTLSPSPYSNGMPAGCAFGSLFDLYAAFDDTQIIKFALNTGSPSRFPSTSLPVTSDRVSRGVVFAANGDLYVSNPGSGIRRYGSDGTLLSTYAVLGAAWLELAANQHTMYFTSGTREIKTFDVNDSNPSAPTTTLFATLSGSGVAAALRLLPDGTGLLVADGGNVKKVTGATVTEYDASGADTFQGLNLDPDGTSFWAGDYSGKKLYKFAINGSGSPVPPVLTISLGGSNKPTGVCVMGQPQLQVQPINLVNSGAAQTLTRLAKFGDPASFANTSLPNSFSTWEIRVPIQANSGGIGAVSFTPQNSSGRCNGTPSTGVCSPFDLRFVAASISPQTGGDTQCVPFFKDPSATGPYPTTTNEYRCGSYRTKDLPVGSYVTNVLPQVTLDLQNPPSTILDLSLYAANGGKGNPRVMKDPRDSAASCEGGPSPTCDPDQFYVDSTLAVIDYPIRSTSLPAIADYSPAQRVPVNLAGSCVTIIKPDNSTQNSGSSIKVIVQAFSDGCNGTVGISGASDGINNSMTLAIFGNGTYKPFELYCATPGNANGCFVPVNGQPGRYQANVNLDPAVFLPAGNPYTFAVTSVNVFTPSQPIPPVEGPGLFPPTSRDYFICPTGSNCAPQ